jgi:hypothetical protein
MFKEPIEIQPNTNYTASATLKARFCLFPISICNLQNACIAGANPMTDIQRQRCKKSQRHE